MSLSIPSDNLRKINNLDEIPYKDINHHKVYNNYLNHMNYLLSLSEEELNNQIGKDINDYNNYIDLIISKNNRITSKVRNEYNNLLTKLTADRNFNRYIEEENDINTIDQDYFNPRQKNNYNVDYDNSMLFNEDEKNFQDEVIVEHEEFLNELKNYERINSIDDLLSFSTDYEVDITFIEDSNNYDPQTNNFKDEACSKLIERFKKVDKAIKKYNKFIDGYKNERIVSRTIFDKILNKIIKQSRKFK